MAGRVQPNPYMPVQIIRNEVPQDLQSPLAAGISSAVGNRAGAWNTDVTSDLEANAWDIEIIGPNHFYWSRRFSGEDRDVEVVSEAIRAAVLENAA
jgi:hypothetical protein